MRRVFALSLVVGLSVAALSTVPHPDVSAAPPSALDSQDLASRIERVESRLTPMVRIKGGPVWSVPERMESLGVPGLAVAVINDYQLEWVKGYGVTDIASAVPVTDETLFQAASISKPFAAAIALHFVDEGLLDLDEDVNVKLASWKVPESEFTQTEKVTLRRILSHTAGLTVSGFRGYGEGEPVPNILEVLDGLPPANSEPVRVDVVPGTIFRYSGGGYTVLQLLLEDVTGRPVYDLARQLIFGPAGMANSSFARPLPQGLAERTASAHGPDGVRKQGHWFIDTGSMCCGLWTTPADLARFAIEIQKSLKGESSGILSERAARLMVTPQPPGQVGLGMFVDQKERASYFYHMGGNPGFTCVLAASVEGGKGAVVMTNSSYGGALCEMIVRSVAAEYGWPGYVPDEYESLDHMQAALRRIKAETPDASGVSEVALNNLGYVMLQAKELATAVALFTLNTELYPRSANCWDSLAEAYMTSGNRERAIEIYTKALETLDRYPDENKQNQRLRETVPKQLEKLQSGE